MTEQENKPGFLDALFDGAEKMVGGLEGVSKLTEPYPENHHEKENDTAIDAEFTSTKTPKPTLVWGVDKEVSTHHIFEGFARSSICGRTFDSNQIENRKTEIDSGNFKCCGDCLRMLHSRYMNA